MLRDLYHTMVVKFASSRIGSWMVLHVFNPVDRRLMRWSKGALNSSAGTNFSVALLRCTGAKSGKPRDVPLLVTPLDDGFVLVASATGQEKNPAWYYNLKANPECSLLVRPHGEIECVAHEAEGEERERAWAAARARYAGFDTYRERTGRRVPVMILRPQFD